MLRQTPKKFYQYISSWKKDTQGIPPLKKVLPNQILGKVEKFSYLGPELQCLLKVKEDLSKVLIFQHAILDAK